MFRAHRERLLAALGSDYALVGATEIDASENGSERRVSSDLHWISGWPDAPAVALLRPGSDRPFILFVRPREPQRLAFTGPLPGLEGAVESYGAQAAFPLHEIGNVLPKLIQGARVLHCALGLDPDLDALLHASIRKARRIAHRNGLEVPELLVSPSALLHELRLLKDPGEIQLLQDAAELTRQAFQDAMQATAPGIFEHEIVARINARFQAAGQARAFETIVASGPNALFLHHRGQIPRRLCAGELLLIDAGAELYGYGADLTRTWPVSGRFSAPQRELYSLVLQASKAMIEEAGVGSTIEDLQDAALEVICEGLLRLGLIQGSLSAALKERLYKPFLPHPLCHWIGIETHDVGRYHVEGRSRSLESGMALAIEPGLYISEEALSVPERYRGIGIRIEDNLFVQDQSVILLSADLPVEVQEIEELLQGGGAALTV